MTGAVAYFMTMLHVAQDRFEGRKDRGATAVEYGLLVALIAAIIITAVSLLGTQINAAFTSITSKLPAVVGG